MNKINTSDVIEDLKVEKDKGSIGHEEWGMYIKIG